ncbi:hypothetical protein lacNasYZ02_14310 [Lactobacillus nasalidis]|nr:hypothetical protein lacNasYZ01_16890 [Lactobacillus nasalidis]GHW00002.1 hypothetical protein lacNasYZ02_14310 [Lactobacillus nasalidis]
MLYGVDSLISIIKGVYARTIVSERTKRLFGIVCQTVFFYTQNKIYMYRILVNRH